MKTITARLLAFVLVINTVLSFFTADIFAATTFSFGWEKEKMLSQSLAVEDKGSDYTQAFVWWDFGVNNGLTFDSGTYNLSYNIADNKRVEFTVEKKSDYAVVTYKVWDYSSDAYINVSDTNYQVYKTTTGGFVTPGSGDLLYTDTNFCVVYDSDADYAQFKITEDTGFCFKYDNKNIKFKWVSNPDGTAGFYYNTDGLVLGNVYDMDLELKITGDATVTKSIQMFPGINTNTFESIPYANDRKNIIDHSERPFPDENNPSYEPEILMSFDMPKVWDEEQHKYVFPDISEMTEADETSVVVDLGNTSDTRKIQIIIDDIYADDINSVTKIATSSDATVETYVENDRVYINLKNLVSGIIYDPSEISLSKPNNSDFLSDSTSIEQGLIYTFPEYTVVSTAADEFSLQIEPYKDYKGFYTIYQGSTSSTLSKWADYEDKVADEETFYVPINLNAINNKTLYYRVDFQLVPDDDDLPAYQSTTLTSQILKYTPDESDIIIGTPENVTCDDLFISQPAGGDDENLTMTFSWDVAYREILEKIITKNGGSLTVYYNMYKGSVPYDDDEERFATVRLDMTYDGTDFDITVYDDEGKVVSGSWEENEVLVGTDEYHTIRVTATLNLPTASVEVGEEQFLYPNIYFINLKGEYTDLYTKIVTSASIPIDITLNGVSDLTLTQPQGLEANNVDYDSADLTWDVLKYGSLTSQLYQYNKQMIVGKGLSIEDESLKYNFYIAQEKDTLDYFIKYDDNRSELPDSISESIKTYDFSGSSLSDGLDISSAETDDGTVIRDHLRDGGIICIENIVQESFTDQTQTLNICGLDENQTYYVVGETTMLPFNEQIDDYDEDYADHSSYCEIVGFTTTKDNDTPSDSENYPAAPTNFISKDIEISRATVQWDKVKETENPDSTSTLEYEFIRITGQKMDDDLIDARLSFGDTWAQLPELIETAGWRTYETGIYEYDSDGEFAQEDSPTSEYEYDKSAYDTSQITDYTLVPNELYFYYIRTVRMADGEPVAYSIWVPLTLTTLPVENPTNLRVESKEEYDKETQVVISFDIPDIDIDTLGSTYEIQYSLKKDDGDWTEDRDMDVDLVEITANSDGTYHCTYKIKNLDASCYYSLRVRLYNTEMKQGSLYSNVVTFRTEIDQDDYDQDREESGWLERYKDLLDDIIINPYWYMTNSPTNTAVIYRPGAFASIIADSPTSVIDLAQGDGGNKKVYYLPASAIDEAFAANKGFRIVWEDMDVIFTPQSIDSSLNDAILDMKDRIKSSDVKDYYVKLTAEFIRTGYEAINSSEPISPSVTISLETAGTKKDIDEWDAKMAEILLEMAYDEDELKDVLDEIEDNVDSNSTGDEILSEIKDRVDDYLDDFQDELRDRLDSLIKRTYVSLGVNKDIIIAYPADSTMSVIGAKQEQGVWINKTVQDYNGKKAIYTLEPGMYIFAGKAFEIVGLTGVENAALITSLVVKYGLSDFLGKDSALNVNAALTKNMVIGSTARIMGASSVDDPLAYLTGKGISVSGRDSTSAAQTQEIIFLTMKAYEVRTNTSIDTLRIRNYAQTANIKNINQNYKKSVQAAFEIGIYTNTNMVPTGSMTVKEYLVMLSKLASKASL